MRRPYLPSLRRTLRQLAAAYGYTLTIATTIAALSTTHGRPATGELFLFVAGGLIAFGLLDMIVEAAGVEPQGEPETAFPFAGVLNFVSVSGALGAATLVAGTVEASTAWLIAPFAATTIYLVLVAVQVAAVDALRR